MTEQIPCRECGGPTDGSAFEGMCIACFPKSFEPSEADPWGNPPQYDAGDPYRGGGALPENEGRGAAIRERIERWRATLVRKELT